MTSDVLWMARRFIRSKPPEVLRALTDPQFISLWAPVDFEVYGLRGQASARRRSPDRQRVIGRHRGRDRRVARRRGGLDLQASGPIDFEARNALFRSGGVIVDAEVKLGRKTALNARVLRAATGPLLSGGALDRARGRLARELDEVALLAA